MVVAGRGTLHSGGYPGRFRRTRKPADVEPEGLADGGAITDDDRDGHGGGGRGSGALGRAAAEAPCPDQDGRVQDRHHAKVLEKVHNVRNGLQTFARYLLLRLSALRL